LKLPIKDPMLVTARVEGERGTARELSAAIDFNYGYCMVLREDATQLGFPRAANLHSDEWRDHPGQTPWFTSLRGIDRGILVTLPKVSVGPLTAKNVDAVVLELEHPRFVVVDFILGRSFLKNFKLTVDLKKGYLSLD
jgi:hypothetical protein